MIAEACEVKALQPELLRAAVDVSEDPWLRARATSALRNCGDDLIAGQLMPLAKGELLPDPMDDLKGYALEFLWPKYIGANELFSMLTAPNEGNFGAYAMFLTHSLPESLGAADLPAALHWANDFVGQADVPHHDFHRKSLSDAIFVKVWREFEHRPDLTQPFVDHVFKRLKDGGELFKGTDARTQRAYFADLESNTPRRRAFLLAAGARMPGLRHPQNKPSGKVRAPPSLRPGLRTFVNLIDLVVLNQHLEQQKSSGAFVRRRFLISQFEPLPSPAPIPSFSKKRSQSLKLRNLQHPAAGVGSQRADLVLDTAVQAIELDEPSDASGRRLLPRRPRQSIEIAIDQSALQQEIGSLSLSLAARSSGRAAR